jgi:hypothetical protein
VSGHDQDAASLIKRRRKTRRRYEAAARSAWDSYRGAIEAAHAGDANRLVDCLRGHKPLTADDCDRLRGYVETKWRRRLWPDWLILILGQGKPLADDYYDRLADIVESHGQQPGRTYDDLVQRTARLVDILLSDYRVSERLRRVIIAYALTVTSNETGSGPLLQLVRRAKSVAKKAPFPPVTYLRKDVDEMPHVEVTDGYFIIGMPVEITDGRVLMGKKPASPIDTDHVHDLLEKVVNLFNRPNARRRRYAER